MRRISPSLILGLLAIVVACAGSATAATLVTGKQIKNGSLTSADVKDRSLTSKDLKRGVVKRGARGVQGPEGPKGDQGLTGSAGSARAFGQVTESGALSTSKNATVRRPIEDTSQQPFPGHYCITVPGASAANTALIAVPQAGGTYYGGAASGIGDRSIVEVNNTGGLCSGDEFEVITGLTDAENGVVESQEQVDQAFNFIVP